MLRSVKNIFWMLAIAASAQSAFGWVLIGPVNPTGTPDAFMAGNPGQQIGYNVGGGEEGTPKAIKQEYRRNTPVVYYSYDPSFWQYFNTNGVEALEQAFAMFNSVGDVSVLDVNDYPEDSRRVNFQAQALGLLDLKSFVAGLMTQQVGLFEPSRWVWALSERFQLQGPPNCPFNMDYAVYQRNYGVVPPGGTDTYPTTSYVNGVLYSYFIDEGCGPGLPFADAVEFPVDPLSMPYSAVADFSSLDYAGLDVGTFYTSLTRDDVAGLKYIYATNNFNPEAAGNRVTEFVTNDISQAQVITTQDLNALATASKTSTAAQLQAQFPGLTVLSTSNYFGFQITTNITELLVNSPFDPAGAPPSHAIISTNYTTNVVQFFSHTFGNIVTNTYATIGIVGSVTQSISNSPFAPAGSPPTTNTTVKLSPRSGVFGDFFILPANTCDAMVLSNMLTTVTVLTNAPIVTSNATTTTNISLTFTPGSVVFQTNHTLIYLPVTCPVNAIGTRAGVGRLQFVGRAFDPITSQLWDPITNNYALMEYDQTNDVYSLRHFSRRVPRPDIMFSCANFSSQNGVVTYSNTVDNLTEILTLTTTANNGVAIGLVFNQFAYDQTARPGNQAGPGTIVDGNALPTLYILNNQFPVFENLSQTSGTTNTFIASTEADQAQLTAWASFDGRTNAPVVYPNATVYTELQNLMNGPATLTPTLPDGTVGVNYVAQLAAKNGTPPYTWSLAPNSPSLPNGLNISSSGKITGVPTGPAAIYDFTVRITDSAGKYRDIQYTISIF